MTNYPTHFVTSDSGSGFGVFFKFTILRIRIYSLLNCVLTCSHANVRSMLMCSRAYMPCVLMCLHATVPCVLTCWRVYMPCMLTCSRANLSCMSMCSCLACSHVNMPCVLCVPMCSCAITANDKYRFSITCFPYIFEIVHCLFPEK